MVAPGEHGPMVPVTMAETIEPGHAVAITVVTVLHRRHEVVQARESLAVDPYPGRLYRDQPQGGADHDAGQAHSAGGGPEQLRVGVLGHGEGPGGRDQGQLHHVVGETAVAVMVLPVDVRRDRTTDRHITGPRRDRDEPPRRNDVPHQVVQADATTDVDRSRRIVELPDVGESGRLDGEPSTALRRVSVAPAQASGDDAAGLRAECAGDGGSVDRAVDPGPGGCSAAPSGELSM